MSKRKKDVSKDQAVAALWEAGVLHWKLKGVQHKIREDILNDVNNISVVVASRRTGKSFTMCLMALEYCLKKPGCIVKYACPKQKMVKTIIRPIIRSILEDCPPHLRPEWKEADKIYVFPNGSEIHIAGTDNDNADNLRGSAADFALVDEASYVDELDYVVRSVLSPILKTRNGKMVLASTPSRNANHSFVTDFMLPYMTEGRTKIYTIYDNPNFTPEIIQEIISEYPKGTSDSQFKLEYLCQLPHTSENAILPSINSDTEAFMVRESYPRPVFYDAYVGLDIGAVDLTAVVFGYYDYLNATLVIEDELIFSKDVNTKTVAEAIRKKEAELWTNPIDKSPMPPYLRVADNSHLIMLTDMQRDHGVTFIPTRKDNREAAINSLDVMISQNKLIVLEKCKHTIYHMKFAEWDKHRVKFKQLKDSPSGTIKGGHADCLAALIYMHRNVIKSKNPYPRGYGELGGQGVFVSPHKEEQQDSNGLRGWMKSLAPKKRK